jgi:hypothetical protein
VVHLVFALLGVSPLLLDVGPRSQTVLAGEPLLVSARWSAIEPTSVEIEQGSFRPDSPVTLEVTDGNQTTWTYTEKPGDSGEAFATAVEIGPKPIRTELLFIRGSSSNGVQGPLFQRAGSYVMRVVWRTSTGSIRSNAVHVTVNAPEGTENVVFDAVHRDWELLDGESPAALALAESYPQSRYLSWSRLQSLSKRLLDLHNERDPETGQWLTMLRPEQARQRKAELLKGMMAEIEHGEFGALTATALATGHQVARMVGDSHAAARFAARLRSEYPDSMAAARLNLGE